MKKRFKKNGGFTLVEIIIAFAVFAIMAVMIIQMLNLTINRRVSNAEFAKDLEEQEQALIAKGKNYDFDTTHGVDGTLNLNFDGISDPMLINYQLRDAEGEVGNAAGINYFVGEIAYNGTGSETTTSTITTPGSTPGTPGGAPVSSRFDTLIQGMRGINYIEIKSVQKLSDTKYMISVCADASTVQSDDLDYAQYTLFMGRESDNLVIERLTVNNSAGLSVRKSGLRGVRIGAQKPNSWGSIEHITEGKVVQFTVEFDKAPAEDLTVDSFGSNSVNGRYEKYQSDTANIYGAFEKAPAGGDTSDTSGGDTST